LHCRPRLVVLVQSLSTMSSRRSCSLVSCMMADRASGLLIPLARRRVSCRSWEISRGPGPTSWLTKDTICCRTAVCGSPMRAHCTEASTAARTDVLLRHRLCAARVAGPRSPSSSWSSAATMRPTRFASLRNRSLGEMPAAACSVQRSAFSRETGTGDALSDTAAHLCVVRLHCRYYIELLIASQRAMLCTARSWAGWLNGGGRLGGGGCVWSSASKSSMGRIRRDSATHPADARGDRE
jgi:hypothetical protein